MEKEVPDKEAVRALWDFAVRLYGEPGVSEACLALQDRFGVDISLMLWAVWLGAGTDPSVLRAGDRAVGPWRARAIRPARALRRHLCHSVAGLDDEAREEWRDAVKRLEIEAERLALGILAGIGRRKGHPDLSPFAAAFGLEPGRPELQLVAEAARCLE